MKDVIYAETKSVKTLYLIINKINVNIEESNGNKYLTLIPTDKSRKTQKKYKELKNKTRDLIRTITSNSNNYDEKYIKIKFNSDDDLPLE